MKIWEISANSKNHDKFVKWAKATEKKVPKHLKEPFKESWPQVQNADNMVRGAFIVHWSLINQDTISEVAIPITIGSLSYMQQAAETVGRLDLVQILQTMMYNIPRVRHEITMTNVSLEEESDEEE